MKSVTRTNGEKTSKHTRFDAVVIQNKDPNYDYSFRRRKDIEDGGGKDIYGFEAITAGNNSGETFGSFPGQSKTKGTGQMVYVDTIACRRPKEVTRFFKQEEDERYNAQVRHVMNASKRTKQALRDLDPDSVVVDKTTYRGPGMTQRKGPTEGDVNG